MANQSRNKLVTDAINLLNQKTVKIEKEGNSLRIDDEEVYDFPVVSQPRQTNIAHFR